MRRSETLSFASREAPDEDHAATRTLRQAGLVSRFGSGRFGLTPTGERVRRKIVARLRARMVEIGGQEVSLPTLQGHTPWARSGRWQSFEGEMFTLTDREGRELCLAPTHEEGVVELVRGALRSYDDLPALLFQVGQKYRDDHARNGLLRTKEFTMKDAYSLHATAEGLDRWYDRVRSAYLKAFADLGLDVVLVGADNSVMGGSTSEEFVAPVDHGTVDLKICDGAACRFGVTEEVVGWDAYDAGDACPRCGAAIRVTEGVEVGHIFQLGTRYSDAMDLTVDHPEGRRPVQMGSYGIGVTRVLQTLVQQHRSDDGCGFPVTAAGTVAPYDVAIVPLRYEDDLASVADRLHDDLGQAETLLFDEEDVSIGERFAISERLGIPLTVILGQHFRETGRVEIEDQDGETRTTRPEAVTGVVTEILGE